MVKGMLRLQLVAVVIYPLGNMNDYIQYITHIIERQPLRPTEQWIAEHMD